MNVEVLLADLLSGNTPALARAISMIENGRSGFEALLTGIHHKLGRARRIGITGPPGAGKSTLTERIVATYREQGLTVAVVAVDPTSPFTGGALLGDRIRMESVALDRGVYIRSMGTRGSLGGLATTTREVCDVIDAAGFDRIIIETVGVGQSELDVTRMAESTVLVLVPESGDGIQTLKSGVMEAADLFVVNKADRTGAEKLRQEVEVMLGIRRGNAFRHVPAHHGRVKADTVRPIESVPSNESVSSKAQTEPSEWTPPVLLSVATKSGTDGSGVDELVAALDRHHDWLTRSGMLLERRRARLLERTREAVDRATRRWLWAETHADQTVRERLDDVVVGRLSPYEVAGEIVDGLRQGARV